MRAICQFLNIIVEECLMNRVFKKVFPFMLAVLIAFSLAPATASFADEPGHT